jgi:hypothetical protein
MEKREFSLNTDGAIRTVMFQDDTKRQIEVSTLYRLANEMKSFLKRNDYDPCLSKTMSPKQLDVYNLLEVTRR